MIVGREIKLYLGENKLYLVERKKIIFGEEKIVFGGEKIIFGEEKKLYFVEKKIRVVAGNFVICGCQPRHLPRHISLERDLPFIPTNIWNIT